MPRAFCPECASEVPVDPDGVCHVGHRVGLAGASAGPEGGIDAAFPPPPEEPDEPQPWVASVDETSLGGYTPPPGGDTGSVPPPDAPMTAPPAASAEADEPAWTPAEDDGPRTFDIGGEDDLASAAAAAVESLHHDGGGSEPAEDEAGPDPVEARGGQVEAGWPQTLPSEGAVPGWTPPTNDPVAPPPVPAPAPADPPAPSGGGDDLGAGDFDFDDLAAAVSELGLDEPAATPTAGAAPAPAEPDEAHDDVGHLDEGAWADLDDEPGTGPADELDLDEDVPQGEADEGPGGEGGEGGEAVDLSNFTAKGRKARGDGGGRKGGLFRRR